MLSKSHFQQKMYIIIVGIACLCTANAEWAEPYFLNANIDVHLQDYNVYQRISFDEEIPTPFELVKINYSGNETPFIGAFLIGDNNFLGATIAKDDDDEWVIKITKRQDYENEHQRTYVFSVNVKSEEQHSIRISLKNVFDNNPTVTYYPSPCRVEELKSNYITDCIFDVYDADGMYQNNIVVKISGQNIDENMFALEEVSREMAYNKQYALKILEELHYEQRAAYNLIVTAYDLNKNQGNISAILEVIDVPNMDPVWVKPLTTETFPEKTEQIFYVKAIDGDTGINKPIRYRLDFIEKDYSSLMRIEEETGELKVNAIDRDEMDQDIFTFHVCAYKFDNESWIIKNVAVFVVQDINDHFPEIDIKPSTIEFLENTYLTLDLEKFIVNDMDFGINATYNVSINNEGDRVYAEAFNLMPNSGYKLAHFQISTKAAHLLDYENEDWREFSVEIVAQELSVDTHVRRKQLDIILINWNDEKPIFNQNTYVANVYENVKAGFTVATILATDRDIDDHVVHSIAGSTKGIQIDEESGVITLLEDNVFDYERQTAVILQIMAKDSLVTDYTNVLNTVYAQLTINIIDVNDETPVLVMPRVQTNIVENSPDNTEVTSLIVARDPDTTANLEFEILWDKSYATKGGQQAEGEFYEGCFLIEKNEINRNNVEGHLIVNPEFRNQYEIDYEKYDTIFLTLRVTDVNQEENLEFAEDILTVRVIDVNDNPPEFVPGTLTERRKVVEEEDVDTIIGSILAFDIDGPGNNKITYSMRPIGELTDEGLVAIDKDTGVLKVTDNIQCDVPRIVNLEYEIILSDDLHTTRGNIEIYIVDINNKSPQMGIFEQQVSIEENSTTGLAIGQVEASDDDRDKPHNVLQYTINFAGSSVTKNLFFINISTGQVVLNIRNGVELDRDNGVEFHLLNIDVADNFDDNSPGYGPSNHASTFINVTLLDVNDNAPQMPLKNEFKPQFFEQDLKGTLSKEKIIAPDNDEPNTPNSRVSYEILNTKPVSGNAIDVQDYEDLFGIEGDDEIFGQILVQKDLKGYYGLWEVEIKALDHGDPVMWNISTYEIYIRPYNFHAPQILFPIQNKPLRLCMLQEPGKPLLNADCLSQLKPFEAFDPDGEIFGDVNFTLSSVNHDDQYFTIFKESRSKAHLFLKNAIDIGVYIVNVLAIDGDGKASNEITNLRIVFIDMQGSPVFTTSEFKTDFTENEEGLQETRIIPEAEDPKNEGIDDEDEINKMYYFIDENFQPNDAKLFALNKETRELKLTQMLDREAVDNHTIRIRVTNNEDGKINNPNSVSYLTVTITVNDVNDNPPVFNETNYAAGITVKDSKGKQILTFYAHDPDLNDPTSYVIKNESIQSQGENIDQYKYDMFDLDKKTGVLRLATPVSSIMKGYFMFDVMAYDTADPAHFDTVSTKIYIIAEGNRVKFLFLSDVNMISRNEKFIREEFEDIYGYQTCNIDNIEDMENRDGRNGEDLFAPITEVVAHFIHNNQAVEASEIQKRSDDLRFISKLQNSLQRRNLILKDVPHSKLEEVQQNLENLLTITLIAVSVVLVTLCVMLVIAYVMKTRALNRRLKAFEPPEFGSTPSNLNRMGAPTTNIFSVEGSNPVINNRAYNRDPHMECKNNSNKATFNEPSVESDDEYDFIGLSDDPTFIIKENNKSNNFYKTSNNYEEINNEINEKY